MFRRIALCTSLAVIWLFGQLSSAIDITPSVGGGPIPQTLAEIIADPNGGVAVVASSASTEINNPSQGNPNSDPRAMGSFDDGMTAAGASLPEENGGPAATYAGGIDIDSGVCLCTGVVSDSLAIADEGLGFGVEGPNNGDGEGIFVNPLQNHTGEITTELFLDLSMNPVPFVDQDFEDHVFPNDNPGGGDPTVLEFDVEISEPGFLRLSFVFGSDEHPYYTEPVFQFNDSIAIIIDGKNIATLTMNSEVMPFSLYEVTECPPIFIENNTAPEPEELTVGFNPMNLHAIPGEPRYDIEFGGFTEKLTRETKCPLAPGIYSVKIVVQDVVDQRVDAAVFLEENSLKLYSFLKADFNLDGTVDGADFSILSANWDPLATDKKFTEGDANGDGAVGPSDLSILSTLWGASGGNKNFCADFNRDGAVDCLDFLIWQRNAALDHCASRFEGDANGDGAVAGDDLDIWNLEFGGTPSGLCGCEETQEAMAMGEFAKSTNGKYLDTDDDGDFDKKDFENWMIFYLSEE